MHAHRLPLADPPILGYHYIAYPLSVMALHDEFLPWYHSNYIQLCCAADMLEQGTMHFDFYNYDFTVHPLPWLDIQRISRSLLSASYRDQRQFLKHCIDRGLYIYLFLNEYYLPNKRAYLSEPFYHDNFIVGYDDAKQIYHTVGYDKAGIYREDHVSYAEMKDAFEQVEMVKEELNYIHLFQFRSDGRYDFDLELVKRLLYDYLESNNTSKQFSIFQNPKHQIYGLNVYVCLTEYLEHLFKQTMPYDIRPFHILWEHKKCMLSRMRFIQSRYQLQSAETIVQALEEIEQIALIVKTMMMKYDISNNPKIIVNNMERIRMLKLKEQKVITEMMQIFEQLEKNEPNR